MDYGNALVLIALPWLLGWTASVTVAVTALAITALLYSLLTRYELGVVKLLLCPFTWLSIG
jgi:hypothetical protein